MSILFHPTHSMEKKDWIIIIRIIGVYLLVALLVNLIFLSDWKLIPTNFSNEAWFGFWASYLTGIFATIACYYTIRSANKNSQQAIMQQNAILIRQKSDEIYKEIAEEIKLQVSLFNLVNFTSTMLVANEDNLSSAKEEVLKKKSSIAERQLHWALLKNLYLNSEFVSPIAAEYDTVWNNATAKLEEYAKLELDIFNATTEEKDAEKTICDADNALTRLNQMRSEGGSDPRIIPLIAQYEQQKIETLQKQHEARLRRQAAINQLNANIACLQPMQDEVFSASVKLLAKLAGVVFVREVGW